MKPEYSILSQSVKGCKTPYLTIAKRLQTMKVLCHLWPSDMPSVSKGESVTSDFYKNVTITKN